MTTPIRLVRTKGSRQYPRTLALRGKVRVLERWEEPGFDAELWPGWSWCGLASVAERGGDIRERMTWREEVPRRATP
jgi:hypothetical protein